MLHLSSDVCIIPAEVGGRPLYLPLIVGPKAVILVDTGCASDVEKSILPALKSRGIAPQDLTHLVITHSDVDHQGGNAALKALAPDAILLCGEKDAASISCPDTLMKTRYDAYRKTHDHYYDDATLAWLRAESGEACPVDQTLKGGERIVMGDGRALEVVSLPGHSRGHIGLWDAGERILFGGDAIHGAVYPGLDGLPALCPTYLDVPAYRETIARIATMPLQTYVGCHWPVLRGEEAISAFLQESLGFVAQAEAAILDVIAQSGTKGTTLNHLCRALGPKLGAWPRAVDQELCYAIAGHLDDLTQRGLIRDIPELFPRHFVTAL